uniref:Uncharacterized protein n=1 Tax=Lutzomyia longipalpis TaxID=7200 RepID=A0A1B0CMP2_LUTLO
MNPGDDADSIQQHFRRNRENIASGLFWDSIPEKFLLSYLDGTQEVEIKRSKATIVTKLRIPWNVSPEWLIHKIKKRNGLKTFRAQTAAHRNDEQNVRAVERATALSQFLSTFTGCILMDDETYCKADFQQLPGRSFYTAKTRNGVPKVIRYRRLTKFPKKFMVWQAICSCGRWTRQYVSTGSMNDEIPIVGYRNNPCISRYEAFSGQCPMMRKNLSVALAFYAILHLVNEHGLQLIKGNDSKDFGIKLPESTSPAPTSPPEEPSRAYRLSCTILPARQPRRRFPGCPRPTPSSAAKLRYSSCQLGWIVGVPNIRTSRSCVASRCNLRGVPGNSTPDGAPPKGTASSTLGKVQPKGAQPVEGDDARSIGMQPTGAQSYKGDDAGPMRMQPTGAQT